MKEDWHVKGASLKLVQTSHVYKKQEETNCLIQDRIVLWSRIWGDTPSPDILVSVFVLSSDLGPTVDVDGAEAMKMTSRWIFMFQYLKART